MSTRHRVTQLTRLAVPVRERSNRLKSRILSGAAEHAHTSFRHRPLPTPSPYRLSDGANIIKISSESDTRKVAGRIAHAVRESDGAPTIFAIGAASLNVAIKARVGAWSR